MNEKNKNEKKQPDFNREVEAKTRRKLKIQRTPTPGVWFGLGMMGLVGWSVVVPTLLGAALGIWLDHRYPGSHSWTLMFLVLGLFIGCLNAWHWVTREYHEMHEGQEDNNE